MNLLKYVGKIKLNWEHQLWNNDIDYIINLVNKQITKKMYRFANFFLNYQGYLFF